MYDEPLTGEQFGQRRPPLSVTIKAILERYPDGQIFKVARYTQVLATCVYFRQPRVAIL